MILNPPRLLGTFPKVPLWFFPAILLWSLAAGAQETVSPASVQSEPGPGTAEDISAPDFNSDSATAETIAQEANLNATQAAKDSSLESGSSQNITTPTMEPTEGQPELTAEPAKSTCPAIFGATESRQERQEYAQSVIREMDRTEIGYSVTHTVSTWDEPSLLRIPSMELMDFVYGNGRQMLPTHAKVKLLPPLSSACPDGVHVLAIGDALGTDNTIVGFLDNLVLIEQNGTLSYWSVNDRKLNVPVRMIWQSDYAVSVAATKKSSSRGSKSKKRKSKSSKKKKKKKK
jgi:hypothetical protein